jgi:hypothetical protein
MVDGKLEFSCFATKQGLFLLLSLSEHSFAVANIHVLYNSLSELLTRWASITGPGMDHSL